MLDCMPYGYLSEYGTRVTGAVLRRTLPTLSSEPMVCKMSRPSLKGTMISEADCSKPSMKDPK